MCAYTCTYVCMYICEHAFALGGVYYKQLICYPFLYLCLEYFNCVCFLLINQWICVPPPSIWRIFSLLHSYRHTYLYIIVLQSIRVSICLSICLTTYIYIYTHLLVQYIYIISLPGWSAKGSVRFLFVFIRCMLEFGCGCQWCLEQTHTNACLSTSIDMTWVVFLYIIFLWMAGTIGGTVLSTPDRMSFGVAVCVHRTMLVVSCLLFLLPSKDARHFTKWG